MSWASFRMTRPPPGLVDALMLEQSIGRGGLRCPRRTGRGWTRGAYLADGGSTVAPYAAQERSRPSVADLRATASPLAVAAGLRASQEALASRLRQAAVARFGCMKVDWAGIMLLKGEAAVEAFGIIAGDVEGQVEWWRETLRQQGHEPDQVERLVAEYRRAAMRNLRERLRPGMDNGP